MQRMRARVLKEKVGGLDAYTLFAGKAAHPVAWMSPGVIRERSRIALTLIWATQSERFDDANAGRGNDQAFALGHLVVSMERLLRQAECWRHELYF